MDITMKCTEKQYYKWSHLDRTEKSIFLTWNLNEEYFQYYTYLCQQDHNKIQRDDQPLIEIN